MKTKNNRLLAKAKKEKSRLREPIAPIKAVVHELRKKGWSWRDIGNYVHSEGYSINWQRLYRSCK